MKEFNREKFLEMAEHGEKLITCQESICDEPWAANEKFLSKVIDDNKDTEYGKKYHFDEIKCIEDFREKVPLSEFSDYADSINRMIDQNETNLITSYPVIHYATSSGSVGVPKRIPNSQQNLDSISNISYCVFAYVNRLLKEQNKEPGRLLFLGDYCYTTLDNGCTMGSISAHMLDSFKDDWETLLTSPRKLLCPKETTKANNYLKALFALSCPDITALFTVFMTSLYDLMFLIEQDWKKLVRDIETGIISGYTDIPKDLYYSLSKELKPNPQRAKELRKEFEKGFDSPIIPRIWANCVLVWGIGGSNFSVYTQKLRKYIGDIPVYMAAYAASESFIGIVMEAEKSEYALVPSECFYEFVAVEDGYYDNPLLINELEEGKDYEIIITNRSGFYRYRMLDVVRVMGFYKKMPLIAVVYRMNQLLSVAGEKTTTEQFTWVISQLSEKIGFEIMEYSIYPKVESTPGKYILILELPEEKIADVPKDISKVIDQLLRDANYSYHKYRDQNDLDIPEVRFVDPQTYQLYRELQMMHGISPNQIKPVRIIDNPKKEKFFLGLSKQFEDI